MRKRGWLPALLVALPLVTVVFTLVTQWIFAQAEGRMLDFHQALLFTMETLTTTGYGEMLPFRSPVTTAWALFLMLTGLAVLFIGLATLVGGWLSARFQPAAPRRAAARLRDHVIICGAGASARFLAEELDLDGVPYLLVDRSEPSLLELMRAGLRVMAGDGRERAVLAAAGIERCRAVVAVLGDADNASVALAARSLRDEALVLATVEHAANAGFLHSAGASAVVQAKQTLGQRLGRLVVAGQAGHLDRMRQQVEGMSMVQMPVLPGSALAGKSLRAARVREATGASVLGVWSRGHFFPVADDDLRLRVGSVLVATGAAAALERLRVLAMGRMRPLAPNTAAGNCLLLGFGDVGAGAAAELQRAGIPYRVLSRQEPVADALDEDLAAAEIPWIAGDATDPDDLVRAGIRDASRLIVALDDDAQAVFATLVARELHPNLRIVARANAVEAVTRLYLAGADNVLSVSEVAGVHLARAIAPRRRSPPAMEDLNVVEVPVPALLAGRTLAQGQVGRHTGCLVVAVLAADGEVTVSPDAARPLVGGERLMLFGAAENLQRFRERFGA